MFKIALCIFALFAFVKVSNAREFPGYDKVNDIAKETVLKPIENGRLMQKTDGTDKTYTVNVRKLCQTLVNLHNTKKYDGMDQSNREFLGVGADNDIVAKHEARGTYLLDYTRCVRAIRQPQRHENSYWMQAFSGNYKGTIYASNGKSFADAPKWYGYGAATQWYQLVHDRSKYRRGCKRGVLDAKTGEDCGWSWNYPGDEGKMPFVYRWDPGVDNANAIDDGGIKVGFDLTFTDLGFDAECIVWVGESNACLQCVNNDNTPKHATLTCYDKLAQYTVTA